jgi:formate dehydrogenase subunit gamma
MISIGLSVSAVFFRATAFLRASFNAGEKLVFWSIVVGGITLTASGIVVLFPFSVADIDGIHVAQYVHAGAGTLMIALIIAHIYIGTIGMQGAFEAMYSGEVDLAWAKEHHSVWVAEDQVRTPDGPRLGKDVFPRSELPCRPL